MKTWIDRLREAPTDILLREIDSQKKSIKIRKDDLETMQRILSEREGEK